MNFSFSQRVKYHCVVEDLNLLITFLQDFAVILKIIQIFFLGTSVDHEQMIVWNLSTNSHIAKELNSFLLFYYEDIYFIPFSGHYID